VSGRQSRPGHFPVLLVLLVLAVHCVLVVAFVWASS
jgi:hypothetical protein